MSEIKNTREPKQDRSLQLKEKIINAAYNLICEKGYFNTTTNDIAKEAGVHISSLYSYFQNKDAILFELLDRYNTSFLESFNFQDIENMEVIHKKDIEHLIKQIIHILIDEHRKTKDFNKELQSLYHYKPEVAQLIENHNHTIEKICLELLIYAKDLVTVLDIEVAAIISVELISLTVDKIVFGNNQVETDRMINSCTEAILKYLTSRP